MKHILLTLPLLVAAAGSQHAHAQPGATPPGSMPPYSAPPPTYAPSPYYGQPMPPPAPRSEEREGWNLGFSAGIGSMESSANGGFACSGCQVEPPTGAFDLHVGTMLSNRLALQGEIWMQSRALDVDGMASVNQTMLLLAAQYWLTPRLWLKAGIGFASLSVSYFDGFEDRSDQVGEGGGFMAAVGYELMSSRSFGLDIQLKTGAAGYDTSDAEEVSITAIALGLNWY